MRGDLAAAVYSTKHGTSAGIDDVLTVADDGTAYGSAQAVEAGATPLCVLSNPGAWGESSSKWGWRFHAGRAVTFNVVQVADNIGGYVRWVKDCEVDDVSEAQAIVADLRAAGVTALYMPRYEPD